jgi:putative membrane protein
MSKPLLNQLSKAAALATLVACSGAVLAQSTTTSTPAAGPGTTAAPKSAASASRTEALSRADRKFVEEAAQGGMAEVQHGNLAAQRATNPQVKQFAQRMVQDHSKANDELKAVASARGITLPTTMDRKHHRAMEKLGKLSGAEFDREYMKHMVDDHKKDISLYEKQAKSGKDGDLKSFAAKTLPILQEHLTLAQSTHDAVKAAK